MCQLAAYLGKAIPLCKFLWEPEHSLYVQSWEPQELQYANLNADGFGFGWHYPNGRAAIYKNVMPIWLDVNLCDLANSLYSERWLAMVRSPTVGFATSISKTQPFRHDRYLYLHNGYIKNFNQTMRKKIDNELSDEIVASLRGLNESEYLFALLLQFIADHPQEKLRKSIKNLIRWLETHIEDNEVLLNMIISDGQSLYALRYSVNHQAPSLYFLSETDALWIASEKLDNKAAWETFPEKKLMVADLKHTIEWIEL